MKYTRRESRFAVQFVFTCLVFFSPSDGLSTRLESTSALSRPVVYPSDQRSGRPMCYLKIQSYNGGAGSFEDSVIDSLSKDLDLHHTDVDSYYRACPQAGDCHTIFISFSNGKTDFEVRCGKTKNVAPLLCAQRTDNDVDFCRSENILKAIRLVRKHLAQDKLPVTGGK